MSVSDADGSVVSLNSYAGATPDIMGDRTRLFPLLAAQFRVIAALTQRDFKVRILGHKFGFLMAIAEPLFFVVMLSIAMAFITKHPRIGDSFILFFATGIIPFNSFRRLSKSVKNAGRRYRKCLYLPIVRPVDPFVATMIVEMLLYLFIYFIFFVGHFVLAGSGWPQDWGMTFMPIVVNGFLGLGVGLINASICAYFEPWDKFYAILTMPLLLASGTIHIMDELPTALRNVLWYNPLAHSIIASRNGFYSVYESGFYNQTYYFSCTAAILCVGLIAERLARKKILQSS